MVMANVVCRECGAALSKDNKFCPQCGTKVEDQVGSLRSSGVRCKVCGHDVDATASFCESCGAALKGTPAKPKRAPQKSTRTGGTKARTGFSYEPWQVITGALVVLLLAFFVYTELTRQQPQQKPSVQAQGSPTMPSAATMGEIDQLQRAVDANPNDHASLIRLANILHDAGMHNPLFLNRAINAYAKYLVLKPTDPDARVDMGICYFEMARIDTVNAASLFSRAIREMETAVKANPTHQPASFNLGIVNLNAGNMEESLKWFKKAVEIDANSDLGKKAKDMLEQHSFQGSPN
jgi:cytochrome c-type biogenesis protein CcmH/NrfG